VKFNTVILFSLLFLSNVAYSNYTFAASENQQPTTLELQVIQTRIYEASEEELSKAVKEMCENNGGRFTELGYRNRDMKLHCGSIVLPAFKEFEYGTHLSIDVKSVEKNRITARVRIKDPVGPPVYKKHYYDSVFKQVSETLGLLAIPVEIKKSE
jgi:hypothetical protein